MVRVHENEFALVREYYQIHGNNYTLIVNLMRRQLREGQHNIPDNILRLWRGELTQEQLRRRVRDAVGRRVGL